MICLIKRRVIPRHRKAKTLLVLISTCCILFWSKELLAAHSIGYNTIENDKDSQTLFKTATMPNVPAKDERLQLESIPDNLSVHNEIKTSHYSIAKDTIAGRFRNSREHSINHHLKPGKPSSNGLHLFPQHPTASEGYTLQIYCIVSKELNVSRVAFVLPKMSVLDDTAVRMTLAEGRAMLLFYTVSKQHEGDYKCVASNGDQDVASSSFRITVTGRSVQHRVPRKDDKLNPTETDKLAQLKKIVATNHTTDLTALINQGKRQQMKVEEYCRKYGLYNVSGVLPQEKGRVSALNRHMLLNDKRQVLFCFVPKVGCTNLKVLFFVMQGHVPLSQLVQSRDKVDQELLEAAQASVSFSTRTNQSKIYSLRNYFKFVMYRNPLERLVSGFRSKVQRFPLVGLSDDTPHFNWLRKEIYLKERPMEYQKWLDDNGRTAVNITFNDFISYFLSQPVSLQYDEHFQSISSMCQPCRVEYNFYGNFKHFDSDANMLIEKIHGHPAFLRSGYYSSSDSTQTIAPSYYAELSVQLRLRVLQVLAQELDFYYHIFPEEHDSHKAILSVSENLP